MANIKVRHLVQKGNSFYWQPTAALREKGWKPRKLANNLEAAIAEAEKINDELDRWRVGSCEVSSVPVINSVKALIAAYQRSNRYLDLSPRTKIDYDYRLSIIEKWAGKTPVSAITPAAVENLWQNLARTSKYKANMTITILRLILFYAIRPLGWIQFNPASHPGLGGIPPRDIVWEDDEIFAFVKTADRLGYYNLGTAVLIGVCLAQREGDILSLDWRAYDGHNVLIKQNKTGAYICVPVHPVLKARLDAYPNKSGRIIRSEYHGGEYPQSTFIKNFSKVRKIVCEQLPEFKRCQFLDLRRSAIVRLAEVGCTEAQISAVSGHKIDTCRRILETYLPRNSKMAREAIAKFSNTFAAYLPAAA